MSAPAAGLAGVPGLFPGTRDFVYLDSSAHGLSPGSAKDAVVRYMDDAVLHGGTRATMRETLERVRGKLAGLIGAEPDEIAVTKNVSEGLNVVVGALPWRAGDNAVICRQLEHPNVVYCLLNVRERHGIEVRAAQAAGGTTIDVDAIAARIDARTRLVAVSSLAFGTGARTDLDRLADLCRRGGVMLLVDAAQTVGALALDLQRTQVDALAIGASKYLCGPPGLGFLYVRRAVAEGLRPAALARYGVDLGDAHESRMGGDDYALMPAARRFEVGSFNYLGLNAIEPALDILHAQTPAAVERHVLGLARRFANGAREAGVSTLLPPEAPAFSHVVVLAEPPAGPTAAGLFAHLRENRVRLSVRDGRLRLGFHLYNTADEVDLVLSLIRGCPPAA